MILLSRFTSGVVAVCVGHVRWPIARVQILLPLVLVACMIQVVNVYGELPETVVRPESPESGGYIFRVLFHEAGIEDLIDVGVAVATTTRLPFPDTVYLELWHEDILIAGMHVAHSFDALVPRVFRDDNLSNAVYYLFRLRARLIHKSWVAVRLSENEYGILYLQEWWNHRQDNVKAD